MCTESSSSQLWRASNLHTHTWRCHHAQGDVDEYCRQAHEKGLRLLGISDHTPLPDGRWASIRMAMSELDGYDRAVEAARRHHPSLRILKGMECEFVPEFSSFFRETLLGERKFDYLVGGIHLFRKDAEWHHSSNGVKTPQFLRAYTDFFISAMASGLFTFMAHPDLFAWSWPSWDVETQSCVRAICDAARDLNMPLEINANGLRQWPVHNGGKARQPYPWLPFWEVAADCRVQCLVSADAHHPEEIHDRAVQQAFAMAESLLDQPSAFSWLESLCQA